MIQQKFNIFEKDQIMEEFQKTKSQKLLTKKFPP